MLLYASNLNCYVWYREFHHACITNDVVSVCREEEIGDTYQQKKDLC